MRSLKILIVEDVDAMRKYLEVLLSTDKKFGICASAKNTWEARLAIEKNRPDLVLLDEILPGESSMDLFQDLQEKQIPVIMLTGMENPKHKLPKGALGRIKKPEFQGRRVERKERCFSKTILDLLANKVK